MPDRKRGWSFGSNNFNADGFSYKKTRTSGVNMQRSQVDVRAAVAAFPAAGRDGNEFVCRSLLCTAPPPRPRVSSHISEHLARSISRRSCDRDLLASGCSDMFRRLSSCSSS